MRLGVGVVVVELGKVVQARGCVWMVWAVFLERHFKCLQRQRLGFSVFVLVQEPHDLFIEGLGQRHAAAPNAPGYRQNRMSHTSSSEGLGLSVGYRLRRYSVDRHSPALRVWAR